MGLAPLLALAGGILVGLSFVFNARLGRGLSLVGAAFWGHLIGFILLCLVSAILFLPSPVTYFSSETHWYSYLGGVLGVAFVTLNAWVFNRLGASKTTLLVISGQMLFATAVDSLQGRVTNEMMQMLGVLLLVLGVGVGVFRKKGANLD